MFIKLSASRNDYEYTITNDHKCISNRYLNLYTYKYTRLYVYKSVAPNHQKSTYKFICTNTMAALPATCHQLLVR